MSNFFSPSNPNTIRSTEPQRGMIYTKGLDDNSVAAETNLEPVQQYQSPQRNQPTPQKRERESQSTTSKVRENK